MASAHHIRQLLPIVFSVRVNYAYIWIVLQYRHALIQVDISKAIIAIQWQNEFAFGQPDAGVPSGAQPSVRLMHNSVARLRDFVENPGGFGFGRPVIDDDHFDRICAARLLHAGKRFAQHRPVVVARDNNGYLYITSAHWGMPLGLYATRT